MDTTLTTDLPLATDTVADRLGGWFISAVPFLCFDSLPFTGRKPYLLAASLGIFTILMYTRRELERIRFSLPVVAMLAWAFLSVFWTVQLWRTRQGMQLSGTVAIVAVCVASVVPYHQLIKGLLRGFYAMLVLTIASLVFAPGKTLVDANGYHSVHGYFSHKNSMAPYMAVVIGVALALETRPKVRRWVIFGALGLIVGSLSATGLIAAMLIVALDQLLKRLSRGDLESRTVAAVVALVGIIVGGAFVVLFLPDIIGVYGKDVTLSGRTKIWTAAQWAIRQRPIQGYGLEAPWQGPNEVFTQLVNRIGFTPTHAHNGYYETLLELGVVGLGLVLWIVVGTASTMWRFAMRGNELARLAFGVLIALLVCSFSEPFLLWPWLTMVIIFRITGLRMRAGEVPVS